MINFTRLLALINFGCVIYTFFTAFPAIWNTHDTIAGVTVGVGLATWGAQSLRDAIIGDFDS